MCPKRCFGPTTGAWSERNGGVPGGGAEQLNGSIAMEGRSRRLASSFGPRYDRARLVPYRVVQGGRRGARRRLRAGVPRRRQLVVRFTEEEFEAVRARAELAGLAVGAWIGQAALDAATGSQHGVVGLPDLLRLHADVLLVAQLLGDGQREGTDGDVDQGAGQNGERADRAAELLERLDRVVDDVVASARPATGRAAAEPRGVPR